MKRNKHITINVSESELALIERIAAAERRTVAEVAYLILIDNAINLYNHYYTKSDFKKAQFIVIK